MTNNIGDALPFLETVHMADHGETVHRRPHILKGNIDLHMHDGPEQKRGGLFKGLFKGTLCSGLGAERACIATGKDCRDID